MFLGVGDCVGLVGVLGILWFLVLGWLCLCGVGLGLVWWFSGLPGLVRIVWGWCNIHFVGFGV